MEPLAVGAVVTLIARYAEHLAGAVVDSAVADRLRRLWDSVTARFSGDPVAEGALRRLQGQPDNANRRGAVEDHLQELAENDPEFARSLAALLREAADADGDSGTVRIDDAGAVTLDGSVVEIRGGSIAAGRDVKVDGPHIPAARPSVENG
ncbi:hypothetical protein [Streptomyces sp. NBC_01353]|uniref:hypothetical protein n=1 Tax=Streptomyces sp. NBC_01353 TaxID=2903835 RepID=UPI002E313477|nr:hypothetical protein [Streptomyces sp. NBC_01353]